MSILVLAEHNNEILKEATKKAITAASKIGNPVHVLVAGTDCANAANDAASTEGVEKVLHAENSQYKNMLSEPISELLIDLMSEYDYLVSAATTNGKNILPRVAAKGKQERRPMSSIGARPLGVRGACACACACACARARMHLSLIHI